MRVGRLLVILLCACHWLGCLWYLVSSAERSQGVITLWQPGEIHAQRYGYNPLMKSKELGLQYAHAFLWGASLISGFMPFDVMPETLPEVITTIGAVYVGLFMSTVIISSSTTAMQAIDGKKQISRQKLEKISGYLQFKQVSPMLTRRIIDFFEYQMTSTKSVMELQELRELPYKLQMMLFIQLHKGLIGRCPIFKPLPERAVLSLLRRLKPEVYPPATLLIQENMPNDRLYFISEGVVHVWKNFESQAQRQLIATLKRNSFFGEHSLMTADQYLGGRANATVQTVSFCDLLILGRDDFDDVLRCHLEVNPSAIERPAPKVRLAGDANAPSASSKTLVRFRQSISRSGSCFARKQSLGQDTAPKPAVEPANASRRPSARRRASSFLGVSAGAHKRFSKELDDLYAEDFEADEGDGNPQPELFGDATMRGCAPGSTACGGGTSRTARGEGTRRDGMTARERG